jgi:chromosome segregation ATPase
MAFRRWLQYVQSAREEVQLSSMHSLEQQLEDERALAAHLKDETLALREIMERQRVSVCHQVEERLLLADGMLKEASHESQSILDQAAAAVASKTSECKIYAARLEDCQVKNLRLMSDIDELSQRLDAATEQHGAYKEANASLQDQLRRALEQVREAWDVQSTTEARQVPAMCHSASATPQ